MAPGDLQEVLAVLKPPSGALQEALLVGLGRADDAAVYKLGPDLAIVETVDFFPPVVDDAYTWGAVAAANAMSDVYAMGGEVLFALAVAGFPRELPKTIIADVFRGGSDKVAEAGGIIAGGHTVVDNEPKYGLCVTGRVHPDRLFVKGGLRPGDRLFLSKPLGTGVVTTAGKASGAGMEIVASRIPLLPEAPRLAEQGQLSGGMKRNRRHVEAVLGSRLAIDSGIPEALASLLFESETSGGLLFAVAPDRADGVLPAFARCGEGCWEIGRVLADPVIRILP
jgi:selenide,water dikinase